MTFFPALALLAAVTANHLPFSIDTSEDASRDFPGAPRIQSFSFGQWKGRWVFIGGRIAGYHGVGGGSAEFLRADANRDIWVIDTTVRPARTYHVPVAELPSMFASVKDEWTASGALYFQDGESLYIAGGYGQNSQGEWVTFPVLTKVDLPRFIDGVMHRHLTSDSISFVSTPLVQSAGGELVKLADGCFYLVMGHLFMGSYTAFEGQGEHNSPVAPSQKYLNAIRKLKITDTGRRLTVTLVQTYVDAEQFHRRDLNVTQTFSPQGLGLAAYGGVFTPDTQLSYSHPVFLFPNAAPAVDEGFEQKMNAYACARMLIYDDSAKTMYTTFFGGISRYFWNASTSSFQENPRVGSKTSPGPYLDGLEWSDQVSTIRKMMVRGGEKTEEVVNAQDLPAYVGADGVFIPDDSIPRASIGTSILELKPFLGQKKFAGYLFGGIRAFPYQFPYTKNAAPYNAGAVPTSPNSLILKVYLCPQ